MNRTIVSSLAVSTVCALSASAANLILNGSFEEPLISPNTASLVVPSLWSGTGSNGYIINGDYGPGYPLAQEGVQYAFLGNNSSISQLFTVGSADMYTLSWFDSTEFNGPGNQSPYVVSVLDSNSNIVVSQPYDANASVLRLWRELSIELDLTPGEYDLRFSGNVPMFGPGTLIDNVSVSGPPSSVPDSGSSLLLLALGIVGATTARRCFCANDAQAHQSGRLARTGDSVELTLLPQ